MTYHVFFLVDVVDLNHREPNLVLQGHVNVQNCFIWSSKWFLSGAGYHIVLEREPHCDVEKVSAMIQSHIPDATLENCTGAELSFILPKEYAHRYRFREF